MAQVIRAPAFLRNLPVSSGCGAAAGFRMESAKSAADVLASLVIPHPPTTATFVKKLFDLVNTEPDDLVCWVQGGTAFEIKDPKKLEKTVLPRYFRHSKFKSFARQLCFYSFRNISQGKRSWIYKHDLFRQGHPQLLDLMRRRTASGASKQLADSVAVKALAVVNAQQQQNACDGDMKASDMVPQPASSKPLGLTLNTALDASQLIGPFSFTTPRTGVKRSIHELNMPLDMAQKKLKSQNNLAFFSTLEGVDPSKKLTSTWSAKNLFAVGDDDKSAELLVDPAMFQEIARYTDLLNDSDVQQVDVNVDVSLDGFNGETIFSGEYDDYMEILAAPFDTELLMKEEESINKVTDVSASPEEEAAPTLLQQASSATHQQQELPALSDDIASWFDGAL